MLECCKGMFAFSPFPLLCHFRAQGFQRLNHLISVDPMQYLEHTYTKKLLVVYLKFKFHGTSYTKGQPKNQSQQSVWLSGGKGAQWSSRLLSGSVSSAQLALGSVFKSHPEQRYEMLGMPLCVFEGQSRHDGSCLVRVFPYRHLFLQKRNPCLQTTGRTKTAFVNW